MNPFMKSDRYHIPGREVPEMEGSPGAPIWVIVRKSEYELDEYRVLLEKILQSVNFIDDTRYLLLLFESDQSFYLHHLFDQNPGIKTVISFGVGSLDLGLNAEFKIYQPARIGNFHFLFSDHLHQIATDPLKKKALWSAIKNMEVTSLTQI